MKGIVVLLINLVFGACVVVVAVCIYVWMRSDSSTDIPANGLIKHRKTRHINNIEHSELPDASSAHQHEKKLAVETKYEINPNFIDFDLITSIDENHHYHRASEQDNIRKPHPLLSALASNITDAKSLYNTVKTDPELVAKIINVSNSPLFGLSKPILNVNHAIVYLGIVQVKNIATHYAMQKSLSFADKHQEQTYQKIWSASFLASSIASILCKALDLENVAELSTRCQLSYLGDISTLFSKPETSELYSGNTSFFERLEYIQNLTDANSAILSGILVKKWNLPKDISNALHNGALPFTNQLSIAQLSEPDAQEVLICYCCCRLADSIIYDNTNNVITAKELSFEATGKEEFYYMPKLLEEYNLSKLTKVFSDSSIKARLAQTIELTVQKLD
jgi:HD-like signal output (HDOD) protein